ncbi:hypothetical protein NDU88_006739 [Pleurodeles waltl]|uniref:Uncharacterized protein n=1 Tax=Pleurodeles waltl TaxID=8319 RepID=A0AAV7N874_PLEWA|nr:hypothetical protein NDU88_006739 [Pleurodeles waltl]
MFPCLTVLPLLLEGPCRLRAVSWLEPAEPTAAAADGAPLTGPSGDRGRAELRGCGCGRHAWDPKVATR